MPTNANQAADALRITRGLPTGEPAVATLARGLVDKNNNVLFDAQALADGDETALATTQELLGITNEGGGGGYATIQNDSGEALAQWDTLQIIVGESGAEVSDSEGKTILDLSGISGGGEGGGSSTVELHVNNTTGADMTINDVLCPDGGDYITVGDVDPTALTFTGLTIPFQVEHLEATNAPGTYAAVTFTPADGQIVIGNNGGNSVFAFPLVISNGHVATVWFIPV